SPMKKMRDTVDPDCKFVGDPIPDVEARQWWPHRYDEKLNFFPIAEDDDLFAVAHYQQAQIAINDFVNLGDDADEERDHFIGRIVEFFCTTDGRAVATVQWFFKAEDTVIEEANARLVDSKRVFISDVKDDNPLDSIVSKINIVKVSPNVDLVAKKVAIPPCNFYYDMSYSLEYNTFSNIPTATVGTSDDGSSCEKSATRYKSKKDFLGSQLEKSEITLLDLYSGCGAMSTGLCFGASFSGVNLVTVRHEKAENFLSLLKKWEKLCARFSLIGSVCSQTPDSLLLVNDENDVDVDVDDSRPEDPSGEFEVERLTHICFGHPNKRKEVGLHFKGDVDVICGGPPCQGISSNNRVRNTAEPLNDEKNRQLVVFMDIVQFLKPRYVLMENVVDLLKFSNGFLGKYAVSRLVSMDYQARLGIMAAGAYGLPQFRARAFLWGARPSERNVVAYDESDPKKLKEALVLHNAISDLPSVTNDEHRDERPYE
ncbi:hypothetical protein IFM89_010212, partial [Coptis chinensis]